MKIIFNLIKIFLGMVLNVEVFVALYYLSTFISKFVFCQLLSKLTAEASSAHKNKQTKKQNTLHFLFYSNNF